MIDPALLGRLRSFAGNDLRELAGATFAGEIPLTNSVVNHLIAERLKGASGPVSSVQVEALDDDTFSAQVSMRAKMIPAIRILGRIEGQPEPQQPILAVRWSMQGMGPIGMLAAPALTFLKALPRGVRAEDDRILVDVADVLRSQGFGDLLPYVKKVRVHTRRGAFVLKFEMRI